MPTVRMFAQARECAGTGRDEFGGTTVGEVLDAAIARYGPEFAAILPLCKIWVNGEPSTPSTDVGVSDEVAILPPVSGGA